MVIIESKRFRELPKKQAEVFEQIASGNDGGHHPATLKTLLAKGLIYFSNECVGVDALGPIVVQRPFVPTPIHIEWCEWCSMREEEYAIHK